jgi:hypothetical protein
VTPRVFPNLFSFPPNPNVSPCSTMVAQHPKGDPCSQRSKSRRSPPKHVRPAGERTSCGQFSIPRTTRRPTLCSGSSAGVPSPIGECGSWREFGGRAVWPAARDWFGWARPTTSTGNPMSRTSWNTSSPRLPVPRRRHQDSLPPADSRTMGSAVPPERPSSYVEPSGAPIRALLSDSSHPWLQDLPAPGSPIPGG